MTTWVEVNLAAIQSNARAIKAHIQHQGMNRPAPDLIAVIKADAYGHGALPVAQALAAEASMFAVATIEEAIELREAEVSKPILVLFNLFPDQAEAIARYQITPSVCEPTLCRALSEIAQRLDLSIRVHIDVDTGMNRSGLWWGEAVRFTQWVRSLDGVEAEGLFTHFATAEEVDRSYIHLQLKRFKSVQLDLRQLNICPPIVHAANSAATLAAPESHFNAVRVGLGLYGIYPSPSTEADLEPASTGVSLLPALSWKTRVICTHEAAPGESVSYGCTYKTDRRTQLATLRVGYADGYPRSLSNLGEVLIGGARRPVVGRVCMDATIIQIVPPVDVAVGGEAVLIGIQGDEEISVDEIAKQAETISYEILTGIGKRVPRIYVSK